MSRSPLPVVVLLGLDHGRHHATTFSERKHFLANSYALEPPLAFGDIHGNLYALCAVHLQFHSWSNLENVT